MEFLLCFWKELQKCLSGLQILCVGLHLLGCFSLQFAECKEIRTECRTWRIRTNAESKELELDAND